MISIGRFLGHDQKFYDLLEASAQQADSSVHHLVDLLAKIGNKDSFRDLEAFAAEVVPLLASGILRPTIDSKFKMSEIGKAHERLESNQSFGKVVLEWD